jgi:exopolysaccharide biosynthesis polyprenyl glycosylphosphotransferase
VVSEARSMSYVVLAPRATGSGDVTSISAPSLETQTDAPARPSENLGAIGTYSLRTRLLAFDLIASVGAWIGLGYFLTPSGSAVEKLARGAFGSIATLLTLRASGLYRSRVCAKWSQEIGRVVLASLLGAVAFDGVEWSFHQPSMPEVALCALGCAAATAMFRGHFRRWLSVQRARGRYLRSVILVGSNDDSAELWRMFSSEPELGYVVSGVIGERGNQRPWDHLPSSSELADLPTLAKATGASGVLIAANALSSRDLQSAISLGSGHGLHVQVWPGLFGIGSFRLRDVPVSGEPFYYVEPHQADRWQLSVKRAIDVVGSCSALLVTLPFMVFAALAIKLERGGPVLHRQCRVGLNGVPFSLYKLRTMTVGSEGSDEVLGLNQRTDGPLFKNANDPRVTRVGRFLRLLSLDELPQLWNVLRGSMSLVGPRPALEHEVLQFDQDFQRRHTMRPGITGLWQAKARDNPSFNAYRRHDLHYVDNWSLRLDLAILAVTVPTVLAQAFEGLRRSRARVTGNHPALQGHRRRGISTRPDSPNIPNIGDDRARRLDDNPIERELDPV